MAGGITEGAATTDGADLLEQIVDALGQLRASVDRRDQLLASLRVAVDRLDLELSPPALRPERKSSHLRLLIPEGQTPGPLAIEALHHN